MIYAGTWGYVKLGFKFKFIDAASKMMSLPSIEESYQLLLIAGHIDVRLHRNGLSIRSDDTVPVNHDAPVLIMVHCRLY
jgi:hypothetical protein